MRRVQVAVFILALATCAPRGLAQSAISAAGKVKSKPIAVVSPGRQTAMQLMSSFNVSGMVEKMFSCRSFESPLAYTWV